MNKRVFKAANIQEAIASIKEELGPDAMILSTRKVPRKIKDPYAGDLVEVEAALDEEAAAAAPVRQGVFNRSEPRRWPHREPRRETYKEPRGEPFKVPSRVSVEEPVRGSRAGGRTFSPDLLDRVQDDIAQIKDMIAFAGLGCGITDMAAGNFETKGILASFLRAGVSETLACSLIREASRAASRNVDPKALPPRDRSERIRAIKKKVMSLCLSRIRAGEWFEQPGKIPGSRVAAFVGPTGVGKTTTIAKLAAFLSFKKKFRIGLISIDNYRIGAFEQLKAYASIMGLPCVQAFNARDLALGVDRMASMDMVLIDTAGHSHHDREKLDEILNLIRSDFPISVHLALSVTSELINMKEAVSAFSAFDPDTLVFTKIDETRRCGKILDQLNAVDLPVSLVTNGQKVPEDLIIPDRQTMLRIILGQGPLYGIEALAPETAPAMEPFGETPRGQVLSKGA